MASVDETLKEAMEIPGAIGVALVDFGSGMMLGSAGGGPALDLEVAAAGNTEVVRAKMNTMAQLGLKDVIEDILTPSRPYHRSASWCDKGGGLFLLALTRSGKLAWGRRQS